MKPSPLQPNQTYHIYNRGNNRENLFREKRNYHHFLKLYTRYIAPITATYAYCLMPNHFHLLIKIKSHASNPSQSFSNLFNAYTKAINHAYGRTGSLFETPFHRIPVTDTPYFWNLIRYIHQNPQHHRFVDDFRDWPYSSYKALITPDQPTKIAKDALIDWFGDRQSIIHAHLDMVDLDLNFDP